MPGAAGGEYSPLAVTVPVAALPPATLSTAHTTLPPLPPTTANCWPWVGVSTDVRGAIEKPEPAPVNATL